jgi:hypothetical protein
MCLIECPKTPMIIGVLQGFLELCADGKPVVILSQGPAFSGLKEE